MARIAKKDGFAWFVLADDVYFEFLSRPASERGLGGRSAGEPKKRGRPSGIVGFRHTVITESGQ